MAKIFAKDTFAVVDLETTGTQREKGHHIIQFGCAIIKNMKVVKTYSFMINPHHEIPQSVVNLTGIHNEDVQGKDDFSVYAPKIIEILKGTVFVAHNVDFDLPFLNYELVQHGYEALTNKAIDTVELAKIAFPTLPSYKLSDLTAQLKIKHLNPHKADSDAYGTAVLLIKIIHKLESLPQATLNTLSSLSSSLIRDTSWLITTIADNLRKQKRPLGSNYMQVRNIILQKQNDQLDRHGENAHFPINDDEKKKLFKGKLHFRRAQVDLINHLHKFVNNPDKRAMVVEAPNGTGKTFSYLFAYAYQLYSGRKLVVATPTKVLQEQIIDHEIPQLLKVTKLDLTAEVVKSSSHYLDLDGFVQTIFQGTPNKNTLVLQMQILVWLTETKTGDLDELNLTNYNAPLFAQIQHPGDARVGSRFASVDFWNLARKRQEEADILVTNHAYLANHYMDTIWGQNPYLVIDEAHRFTENVISSRNDSLRFEALWGVLSYLRNLLYFSNNGVENQFNDNVQLNFLLKKLDSQILELIQCINDLQKDLYAQNKNAVNKTILANGTLELSFQGKGLFNKNSQFKQSLGKFQQKLEEVRELTNQVLFELYHEQEQEQVLTNTETLLSEITEQIDRLDYYSEKSYQLADILSDSQNLDQDGFILMVTNPDDPLSTNLDWLMLDAEDVLNQIYSRFDHIAFISATLTSNHNFDYAINQLALSNMSLVEYIGKSTFNIKKHLQVIAVNNMPNPDSEAYEEDIEQILINDLTNKNHVLVLMTNLEKIRTVFMAIMNSPELKDFEILAQGISGSNNRIAKRFVIAKKAIIIGADSFWEGIDFHDCGIDTVFAARLPFESPDQPEVRLRQKKLEDQGINVFEKDSLPRAVIRFRQGMGRLIRGEKDHGQYIILDPRLWSKEYGKAFLQVIPVKVKKVTKEELKELENKKK
ncbi:DEAD/DEAH box helicase [Lactobacillus helveticus]|uniref:3'-5' exonuclease DinG n=2 Tax=Lactobacillus helveticus TaxID=1587 RepID=A0AAU8XTT1_LACHE|nr:helicase C-terminal domain-containing protein [Lactobacillus helveticus]ANZ55509.1 ATP-dependent DNA helicase [Lactobacillus helveticus]AQY53615.1 ATP-dependent DNA helicase [Lactobacillus helveticus]AUI74206.1 ATP-dependent DNA helicase [Lactobacillus helveticus]MBU6033762.1 DEAD/DEAH box helicase [Lactobacillus helveticus]MBW1219373.1 DEAD/DEAH box helicase [Lactobacillus helveticus]